MTDRKLLNEVWQALHGVEGWTELGIIQRYNVIVMKRNGRDHYLYLREYRPGLHPPLIQPQEMHNAVESR